MQRRSLLIVGGVIAALAAGLFLYTRPDPIASKPRSSSAASVAETVTNTRAGTIKACQRARLRNPPADRCEVAREEGRPRQGRANPAASCGTTMWSAQLTLAERDAVSAHARADESCVAEQSCTARGGRLERVLEQDLVDSILVDKARRGRKPRSGLSGCDAEHQSRRGAHCSGAGDDGTVCCCARRSTASLRRSMASSASSSRRRLSAFRRRRRWISWTRAASI